MQRRLVDATWLVAFDATLRRHFGIGYRDAGADPVILTRYADLAGEDAAMEFAADYDLDRLEWWSWGRAGPVDPVF